MYTVWFSNFIDKSEKKQNKYKINNTGLSWSYQSHTLNFIFKYLKAIIFIFDTQS